MWYQEENVKMKRSRKIKIKLSRHQIYLKDQPFNNYEKF